VRDLEDGILVVLEVNDCDFGFAGVESPIISRVSERNKWPGGTRFSSPRFGGKGNTLGSVFEDNFFKSGDDIAWGLKLVFCDTRD
jgi:hypothetical protein